MLKKKKEKHMVETRPNVTSESHSTWTVAPKRRLTSESPFARRIPHQNFPFAGRIPHQNFPFAGRIPHQDFPFAGRIPHQDFPFAGRIPHKDFPLQGNSQIGTEVPVRGQSKVMECTPGDSP